MNEYKSLGAGSIGNHISHAAVNLNWNVDVFDIDESALKRMKDEIYPNRYGAWNQKIKILNKNELAKKIMI